MLYNHELVKKLRFSAYGLALFYLGYAMLTFKDGNLSILKFISLSVSLVISIVAAWILRKPNKPALYIYACSLLACMIILLFRIHANLALDITLMALSIGLSIAFWYQIRKKDALAS